MWKQTVIHLHRTNVVKNIYMETKNKGKIIRRISWTETLRLLEPGQTIEADLIDRINIVRHITRISKEESKKFSTKKVSETRIEIRRIM